MVFDGVRVSWRNRGMLFMFTREVALAMTKYLRIGIVLMIKMSVAREQPIGSLCLYLSPRIFDYCLYSKQKVNKLKIRISVYVKNIIIFLFKVEHAFVTRKKKVQVVIKFFHFYFSESLKAWESCCLGFYPIPQLLFRMNQKKYFFYVLGFCLQFFKFKNELFKLNLLLNYIRLYVVKTQIQGLKGHLQQSFVKKQLTSFQDMSIRSN